jgi:hypothetical protein
MLGEGSGPVKGKVQLAEGGRKPAPYRLWWMVPTRNVKSSRARGWHRVAAHLDYLDEAIDTVSGRIGEVIAPLAGEVDRLATIRGSKRAPPRSSSRNSGWIWPCSERRPRCEFGRSLPGEQRERGQAPVWEDPQGKPLAPGRSHGSRPVCHAESLRPGCPVPARHAAPRAHEGDHRRRPRHPHRRLSPAGPEDEVLELGVDYYDARHAERVRRPAIRALEHHGHHVRRRPPERGVTGTRRRTAPGPRGADFLSKSGVDARR